MYRGAIFLGRRGVAIHAMSGIDIALWDIKGKALGQPVSELLGAPAARPRARLRLDADAGVRRPRCASGSPRCASAGFTAVKLGWGPLGPEPGERRRARGRRM